MTRSTDVHLELEYLIMNSSKQNFLCCCQGSFLSDTLKFKFKPYQMAGMPKAQRTAFQDEQIPVL